MTISDVTGRGVPAVFSRALVSTVTRLARSRVPAKRCIADDVPRSGIDVLIVVADLTVGCGLQMEVHVQAALIYDTPYGMWFRLECRHR